jgi:hypothetical protein
MRAAQKFFRYDAPTITAEYIVMVRGSARGLTPIQAHQVYCILSTNHQVEGAVRPVLPRCGPALLITAHIIQHSFNGMWKEIEEHPESHCTDHERCVGRCPSNQKMLDEFGYDCPCCETSPTHFIKARLGLTIFAVPPQLLRTWQREWSMCKPCDWHGQPIKMLKCHSTAGDADDRLEGENRELAQGLDRSLTSEVRVVGRDGVKRTVRRTVLGLPRVEGRFENGLVVILTTKSAFRQEFEQKMMMDLDWRDPSHPFVDADTTRHAAEPSSATLRDSATIPCQYPTYAIAWRV